MRAADRARGHHRVPVPSAWPRSPGSASSRAAPRGRPPPVAPRRLRGVPQVARRDDPGSGRRSRGDQAAVEARRHRRRLLDVGPDHDPARGRADAGRRMVDADGNAAVPGPTRRRGDSASRPPRTRPPVSRLGADPRSPTSPPSARGAGSTSSGPTTACPRSSCSVSAFAGGVVALPRRGPSPSSTTPAATFLPSVHYVGACVWHPPTRPTPRRPRRDPDRRPVGARDGGNLAPPGSRSCCGRRSRAWPTGRCTRSSRAGRRATPRSSVSDRFAPNVHLARWVSHSELLPRCSAVVTTGGANTILASLQAGVPLVVVPTTWDKPDNARRVVETGVGVRLSAAPLHAGAAARRRRAGARRSRATARTRSGSPQHWPRRRAPRARPTCSRSSRPPRLRLSATRA